MPMSNVTSKKGPVKRYNLILPEEIFNEVQEIAKRKNLSIIDVFRKFVRLGLVATKLEEDPHSDSILLFRRGKMEYPITLFERIPGMEEVTKQMIAYDNE
jgi:hypothetical protein